MLIAGIVLAGAFAVLALLNDKFLQLLLAGLTNGSIYALIAIGFTIIYNATDVINFAQGEFAMMGALLAVALVGPSVGLPIWLAAILAVAAVTIISGLFEMSTFHLIKTPSVINMIIITIGASILFKGVAMKLSHKQDFPMKAFSGNEPIQLGSATITPQYLWVIGVTLVAVIILHEFYSRTVTGKALRACAHNPNASLLMGISVRRMVLFTFALSGALGAIAGVVITPIYIANYLMGKYIGLKGFCAAILGGIGSIYGAVVGGLAIGVLEALFAGYLSSGYKDALAFVVLLLVLFVRPQGFLGEPEQERA